MMRVFQDPLQLLMELEVMDSLYAVRCRMMPAL